MEKDIHKQVDENRLVAESLGEEALIAARSGDVGLARTMARQAAQYARMVIQLETGEKQIAPADVEAATRARQASSSNTQGN